jgi:hypothetical protein
VIVASLIRGRGLSAGLASLLLLILVAGAYLLRHDVWYVLGLDALNAMALIVLGFVVRKHWEQ